MLKVCRPVTGNRVNDMEPHSTSPSWTRYVLLAAFILLFSLAGCESGGGGGPVAAPEGSYSVGFFLDSPVEGLQYRTVGDDWKGLTDAQGMFYYRGSDAITFSLGGVVLGSTAPKHIITPVDLGGVAANTASKKVINIAQFLQSLDDDLNPNNGIRISQGVRDALEGITVDFTKDDLNNDAGVQEMFDRLNDMGIYPEEAGLIPAAQAQLHLENTITSIEQEELEAEEALRNLKLQAAIDLPGSNVLMVQGQSLNLRGTVYGGKAPYTYAWSLNSAPPFSRQLNPGNYAFRSIGPSTITFTATDSEGSTKTDILRVNVYGADTQTGPFATDSIPTLSMTYPSGTDSTIFPSGGSVTFQVILSNGNTPLYYGWTVGAAPDNTYNPTDESIEYISPRTFRISQPILLNTPGQYPVSIAVQDTPLPGKGPDQHAAEVLLLVQ